MSRFNYKGMMLFPNPMRKTKLCKSENILVVKECYCPNGHNLINNRAVFNGFDGIIVKVKKSDQEGLVALSPVYGYKTHVSLDLTIEENVVWQIVCPVCNEPLAKYADCTCGGDLVTMFLNEDVDFGHCVVICNRVGCKNAGITYGNELLTQSYTAQEVL